MGINLKIFDLRCFIALCTHKSFTKAANKMCISQPPFSRIIQKLEADMMGGLIDRSQSSFKLTYLGEQFLEEAKQIVSEYDDSMYRLEVIRNPASSDLKIGFTALSSQIPGFYELIDNLSKQASEIFLDEFWSQDLCEKLQNHELDIGIMHFIPDFKSIQSHPIKTCKAMALFSDQICCFKEKRAYHLILNENKLDKPYNQHLLTKLPSYNLTPLYKEPTQLSFQLALQGEGILIYPEPIAKIMNANNTFTLEQIDKSEDLFGIYMITHKNPLKRLTMNIIRNSVQFLEPYKRNFPMSPREC